jgi:hypothetical protein
MYGLETKARFMHYYLGEKPLPKGMQQEFESMYSAYNDSIENDSANILAVLTVLLKYSLHGIEKIKTASRAFGKKYYLPFMSDNVMQFAFSIPSKYKVGRKTGKRIIINSFPEIKKTGFNIASFVPQKLNKNILSSRSKKERYESYYLNGWIKANVNR